MELKDLLAYLGMDAEKTKTLEDFKSAFEPEFVRAKNLNEDSEFVKLISQTNKQTGIISNYQLIQQGVGNGFQNTAGYILDYKGFESKPE